MPGAEAFPWRFEFLRGCQVREEKEKKKGRRLDGPKPRAPSGEPPDKARSDFTDPESRILKTAHGYRRFLLRGLEKVTGEWSLLCTVHNLLKLAAVRIAAMS